MANYKEEVEAFKGDLKLFDEVLVKSYEDQYGICKELSSINAKYYLGNKMDSSNIKNLFLGAIKPLNYRIVDYYRGISSKVDIDRNPYLMNGDALITQSDPLKIYITSNEFRDSDFIAFSHEFGHIPQIENTTNHDSYFYGEILPIFLEYLACTKIDKNNAFELFLKQRMYDVKKSSKIYLDLQKEIRRSSSYKLEALKNRQLETIRYLKSFDYVIQLIDRFKDSRTDVISELEEVLFNKNTFSKMEKRLDIDTDGCRRLIKEAKKPRKTS